MRSESTHLLPKNLALEINAHIEVIEKFCYQQMIPIRDNQASHLHDSITRFYRIYSVKEFESSRQFHELLSSYVCHYVLRLSSAVSHELESKLADMLVKGGMQ